MPGLVQVAAAPSKDLAAKLEGRPDAASASSPDESPLIEEWFVVNQVVTLEVNFREKSVQGESLISILCINPDNPPEEVALDARQCEIDLDQITVHGKRVNASYLDPYEFLDIPRQWDLTPNNYPVWKHRMKHLLPRRRRDLPILEREKYGCTPASGSLRVALPAAGLHPGPEEHQAQDTGAHIDRAT